MIKNILIYNSGGGIGDSIQLLSLIKTLKNEFNNAEFYYLSSHENHFNHTLKDYNCAIKTLELNIKYFGFRWWHLFVVKNSFKKNSIKSFDLIIDLQSKIRNSLILRLIPHKYFISSCFNFKLSKPSINIKKDIKIDSTILLAMNLAFNKKVSLDEFNINTINEIFFLEAKKLLPNNNYVGLSITQGNVYRKKEWPFENIIKLCSKLVEKNKIPVFFIEKKNIDLKEKISNLVPKAQFPEHESNLSSPALVSCLGKRLDFVITIDNGVMHMLALSKVPMISLFGPTNSQKFAPNYKNSIVLDSKKIYNTKSIEAISVEDVLHAAKLHLNF